MAKRIQVGGRIECKEVGGIVTGAAEILDDAKGKKQSVINQETDDELVRLDQSKQGNLTFDNAPTEGSNNPVKSGGVYAADKALSDAIEAILLLIPSAASALNKLVDTSMMNSSISTATATFRGTYNVVTDLSMTVDATHEQIAAALGNAISTADNNDYAFVQIPVSEESTDIRRTERYKFNGTVWGYEYDLNTSGFTAAQWGAINSGITLALVGKLIGLPTSSELQALIEQKQDTLTFDNVPTAGSANPVKSGGVHTAINDEKTAREQLAQTVTGINGRLGDVEEVIPTGAAANNKLVANSSMEAYVTSIIEAITASFTIATADGHINLTLTQTNGRVASLTLTSSDIASAQALTALTGRVSTAEGNITTLGVRVSTNETDIANLQQLYNNLQQSKPEPVTALPETGQQQGVIYRLAGTTSYSDYMWNGTTWVLMATYNNAIDDVPTAGSNNLVKSGGVGTEIYNAPEKSFSLSENTSIPISQIVPSAKMAANSCLRITVDGSCTFSINPDTPSKYYRMDLSAGTCDICFPYEIEVVRITGVTGTLGISIKAVPNQYPVDSLDEETKGKNLDAVNGRKLKYLAGQLEVQRSLSAASDIDLSCIAMAGSLLTITISSSCSIFYYDSTTGTRYEFARRLPAGKYTFINEYPTDKLRFTDMSGTLNISLALSAGRSNNVLGLIGKSTSIIESSNIYFSEISPSAGKHYFVEVDKTCSIILFNTGYEREIIGRYLSAGTYEFVAKSNNPYLRFTDFIGTLSLRIYENVAAPTIDNFDGGQGALSAEKGKVLHQTPFAFADYTNTYLDSLGKYIKSYRLARQLSVPYVNTKLQAKDALNNSAGKTIYNDGYIYVLKYSNHLASGNGESEYLNLAKVSATDPSDITKIIAFDVDEMLTFDDSSTITIIKAHEGAMFIENNLIKVITLVEYLNGSTTDWLVCIKTFDLQLQQVGNVVKCTLNENGTQKSFSHSELGDWVEHDTVFNAGIIKNAGYYYGAFGFGDSYTTRGTYILKSTNFVDWEIAYILPKEYKCYGEVGLYYSSVSSKMYLAARIWTGTVLMEFDDNFKMTSQPIYIKASKSGSMASFFEVNNELYALVDGTFGEYQESDARNYYKIIKISYWDIRCSEFICDTNGVRFGANTICCVNGSDIYGCAIGVNMVLCKFNIPNITQAECDSILESLIN